MPDANTLIVYTHPLAQERLGRLRDVSTPSCEFRRLLWQLASFLVDPIFSTLPCRENTVQTPLAPCPSVEPTLPIVMVPILRAGLGLLDGMLDRVPEAHIGHLGMFRNEQTLEPVPYYAKLPKETSGGFVVLLDPMLATGHSACHAIEEIKKCAPAHLTLATVLASPEGVRQLQEKHPDVRLVTLAIDDSLNEHGYIMPGLGDAGDRYFGT